ncbi:MAG: tetratricopeptide repeat protein [Chloroflexi bacterium]|nr:tetratricopeptide repeat protein [Chloroflexota bacterium]
MIKSQLATVDQALTENDLRKAEVMIARLLRNEGLTGEMRAHILIRRAKARLLSGRPDDALEEAGTVLTLQADFEDHPEVKALLGDIYFARFMLAEFGFADRSNTDMAKQYYNDIIHNYRRYNQIGWVYYQRGRIWLSENAVDDSIADFESSLQQAPDPPFLYAYCHERLGYVYLFEKRDPEAALVHFDQAIAHYPPQEPAGWLVQVHILRSRALRELRAYEDALRAAHAALEALDPNAPDYRRTLTEAHLAIGEVLALIPGREAEAVEHLLHFLQNSKRPLGVDVTWSRVYETLGELSVKLERYEQAIEAFQASLEFNPYHPWEVNVHYQIARCHYRMRAYEKTISAIETMRDVAKHENQVISDYRVFNMLANAHFALEQYSKAAQAYRQAFELAPANAPNREKIKSYLQFAERRAVN